MSNSAAAPETRGQDAPPPFDPDPELIDDLEGNPWTRRSYQKAAEALRGAGDQGTSR